MIRYHYETESTVKATSYGREVIVTVSRYRLSVTSAAMDKLGHRNAEAHAKATIAAIRRARRLYRITYGRRLS